MGKLQTPGPRPISAMAPGSGTNPTTVALTLGAISVASAMFLILGVPNSDYARASPAARNSVNSIWPGAGANGSGFCGLRLRARAELQFLPPALSRRRSSCKLAEKIVANVRRPKRARAVRLGNCRKKFVWRP